MSVDRELRAPPRFDWKRWPETEAFVDRLIDRGARRAMPFAAELAEPDDRARPARGSRSGSITWSSRAQAAGQDAWPRWATSGSRSTYAVGSRSTPIPAGSFPGSRWSRRPARQREHGVVGVRDVAIKVESIAAFSRAHDLGLEILGYPLGPYRSARVPGDRTDLAVVERRGYLGFEPFPGELARRGG